MPSYSHPMVRPGAPKVPPSRSSLRAPVLPSSPASPLVSLSAPGLPSISSHSKVHLGTCKLLPLLPPGDPELPPFSSSIKADGYVCICKWSVTFYLSAKYLSIRIYIFI